MAEALLSVHSVAKVYGTGPAAVAALRDITFRVDPGEAVAITGPSGSGKSTLLNLLGFLDLATSGAVVVGGVTSSSLRPWQTAAVRNRYIGFVFQHFHLLTTATAVDNVALPLVFRGVGLTERRDQASAVLRDVGLGGLEDRLPRQLSGGQQQRVAIARAMVTRPQVVLCDEPTGNLDRRTGEEVIELLLALRDDAKAVVIVTHDEHVADRVGRQVHLVDGRIQQPTPT